MRFLLLLMCTTVQAQTLDLPIAPPGPGPLIQLEDDPRDTPPPTFYGELITTSNDTILFILDRSGSMSLGKMNYVDAAGKIRTGTRLDIAKAELIKSIRGLGDNFKFDVWAYHCVIFWWKKRLVPASARNKRSAYSWIRKLTAKGGTITGPGVAYALLIFQASDLGTIVLLTDGEPNCGATSPLHHRLIIQRYNLKRIPIYVFGISTKGAFKIFCQGVAADSGGVFYEVR